MRLQYFFLFLPLIQRAKVWFMGLLTRLSPDEWSAVGVLAGIVVAVITLCINWYYKRKATIAQIKAYQRWPATPEEPAED